MKSPFRSRLPRQDPPKKAAHGKPQNPLKSAFSATNFFAFPTNRSPKSLFFKLPRELRDQIYLLILEESRTFNSRRMSCDGVIASGFPEEWTKDAELYQPSYTSGFTLLSQPPPPTYLLLVCGQFCEELLDRFYATTTFDVGSLNAHCDEWRPDPTYEKLRRSLQLSKVRKLRILVSLDNLRLDAVKWGVHASPTARSFFGYKYDKLDVEHCISKVHELAELLVRVLRNGATSLQEITVDWKDDLEQVGWKIKREVLLPFQALGTLEGLEGLDWLKAGEVICKLEYQEEIREKLKETLEALSM